MYFFILLLSPLLFVSEVKKPSVVLGFAAGKKVPSS